ncbi:hypothetical protein JK361_22665 [Streptomyces sp. 5-8]|uniref:Uncharacterized protein n=1 Tax=Streptomyces musisoli TaxID=2802280 RepID=A0ABS1P4S5_9ACTN|nr:hypothetical protein [Streptomyces musisoli]MBL1107373.1 hypothetical protein [Streptomyces musisoli]
MSQTSPDARAVVRALDALTTQVRRIADGPSSTDQQPVDGASSPVAIAHHIPAKAYTTWTEQQTPAADELERMRAVLEYEHKRANDAIDREETAEQAAEEQRRRAHIAETELRTLRAGLRANGADPTQLQNLWAQISLRNRQWREAKQERDRARATIDRMKRTNRMVNGAAQQSRERAERAHARVCQLERAIRDALAICGEQGSDVQDILRPALDGAEPAAGPCAQHPDAPVIGGVCGGCTQYPADSSAALADEEQTLRWARRESLLVLVTRVQHGRTLTEDEARTLRQHVETEMREAETARAVAAGNRRHVQLLYAELTEAQAAVARVRALHTRTTVQTTSGPAAACSGCESDSMSAPWPCPTTEALDGTEQPTPEAQRYVDSCPAHDGPCFPEPGARCSAHGTHRCALCHRNPSTCTSELGGCGTWSLEGMHWDTCPNRIK